VRKGHSLPRECKGRDKLGREKLEYKKNISEQWHSHTTKQRQQDNSEQKKQASKGTYILESIKGHVS
jgi:hypothetical protein